MKNQIITLLFGLAVFLFWRYSYPFALTYQEQLQLFLLDGDYLCQRLSEPGGLARYLAEFLVQFYNGVTIGAAILALLFMLVQRLTWWLMRTEEHYLLSFIPPLMLWIAMGDESVLLTYTVALLLTLLATALLARLFFAWGYEKRMLLRKLYLMLILMPLLYWLIGPMALLAACFLMPLAVVYTLALILVSAHYLPYPTLRVFLGISYYRVPMTLPYLLMAIPIVIWLLGNIVRLMPAAGRRAVIVEALAVVLAIGGIMGGWGYDAKRYELIAYDHLVRIGDWKGIIDKAEKQMPDLPMSVSATNLALAMTNQLGDRAFHFYQHGSEGLLPKFERNFATTQLTGEIYFQLGLVNTAQRLAFEAMEAIPNYNKSVRVVKRLAETNLVNGQYQVAAKYLHLLEKTVFYRRWAQRTLALLGNEKAINAHPLYGRLRQWRLTDDFLFSETELDKICGQLFLHNPQNQMAAQYLLMLPLMDKDLQRFTPYAQVVQSHRQYNPRHCQEALALAFMQQRQQPPKGLISPLILQQLNDFSRIYSSNHQAPELQQFRNTVWYYLLIRN